MNKTNRCATYRQIWNEIQWFLLGIIWLAGLLLGYAGFHRYSSEYGLDWTTWDILYNTIQLVIMNSGSVDGRINGMLQVARFLLPALTAFTALQALLHLFREQLKWLRLRRLNGHIIVCGLGRRGGQLASQLLEQGYRVVMIERDPEQTRAAELQRRGGILLDDDAVFIETLMRARMERASHLICLLGDDSQNLRTAFQAFQLTRERRNGRLNCMLHLNSPELLRLVKASELNAHADVPFNLQTFNPYEHAARWLLYEERDGHPDAHAMQVLSHMLIIGMGRLGEQIMLQAAHNWYMRKRRGKLRVTVLDREAQQKMALMLQRYPRLADVCLIKPQKLELGSNENLRAALLHAANEDPVQCVYVCLGDALLSLQVCLGLLQIPVYANIPIHARLAAESGLSGLLDQPLGINQQEGRLKLFDLYESACSADVVLAGTHERLARGLYANYQAGKGSTSDKEDQPQPWEQLSEPEKEDNRRQARHIQHLLGACDYRITTLTDWDAANMRFEDTEVLHMARMEHDLWRQSKQQDGWRLGAQRDNDKRTHPDLVDWEELPPAEQEKNLHFIRRLPGLLAELGFQMDKQVRL